MTYHYARPRQKEVIRQSATQIHKIEENESFDDAFNRFKKQTKEAQHQQEVPIKPAQTGGRVYRWDDRLLLAAKSHIKITEAFSHTNELSNTAITESMRKHMEIPQGEEIFYVRSDTVFGEKKSGIVISESGMYYRMWPFQKRIYVVDRVY